MHKIFTYLKVAAVSGTAVLLSVPFAMNAAMPEPTGSVYNPAAFNLYQPGEPVALEDTSFVALPIKGLRMKDLQGADEGIMNISQVLSYPQDRNWLVFKVSIYNHDYDPAANQSDAVTHKIFRYNIATGQLQRIYREISVGEQMVSFGLVGFDGPKLIIRKTGYDNSPGPCDNLWQDMSMDYYSLNMQSPWKGLTIYKVPKRLMDQGEVESQECVKNI